MVAINKFGTRNLDDGDIPAKFGQKSVHSILFEVFILI